MTIPEIEHYKNVVIPNIEKELPTKDGSELVDLYNLYLDVLKLVAPYDFGIFNTYLEIDEDKNATNKGFYYHRKHHMAELVESLNDMEIYDKYDILLISCPPRVGKTTFGIRFLAWIIGKYPENTQLALSYSEAITSSFYIGVMEIIQNPRYQEVFPESRLVNQNAKKLEIWLKVTKRYPSIGFIPIGGSMTGRGEASNYLYCDDLVSGIEEAMSPSRLDKLWQLYSVNSTQRKLESAKEIHIATRWSVHDPMSKLEAMHEGNPRFKSIKLSCYDENGESNFNFKGGFSTNYYKNQELTLDELSFNALYRQEPVEREGLLYHKEDLQFYFNLPNERPDTIIAVCDSKNLGSDNVASPIGYVYGDLVYIEDVVYNNGLPEVTRPLVANKWVEHNVVRGDVECNNGGNYYAEDLQEIINKLSGNTSIRTFYSSNNKMTKIITYSDFVKKNFVFKHPSTYPTQCEYAKFMKDVYAFTQTGKVPHDDAPDSLAMMAQLVQDLQGNSIKIIDRRSVGI
jgi:predicted phage terminase large subunit-like protein|nr:MAG TPA: Terminase [Bacteriophage sp.]